MRSSNRSFLASRLSSLLIAASVTVAGLAAGEASAHADEATTPTQLTAPAPAPMKRLFVDAFVATPMIRDSGSLYQGVELGFRAARYLDFSLDYSVPDGLDSGFGAFGAGARLRAGTGAVSTSLYLNATRSGGGVVKPDMALRAGFGVDWTAPSGLFIEGQAGVRDVIPEARLGVGFRFL